MGCHSCHLKPEARCKLAKWHEAKVPGSEGAERLGHDPSVKYRHIYRTRYTDTKLPEFNGYPARTAQNMYQKRRAIHRKLIVHPDLKIAIEDRLKAGWSPSQIARRMRLERHPVRVGHETIYRSTSSKDGRDEQFYRHLPEHRWRRSPHWHRRYIRTNIQDARSSSNRPEAVSDRIEFGPLECDLTKFREGHGKVNVTLLVECVSRFAVAMRKEDRQSNPIMVSLIRSLAPLPVNARQSITFDRGTELAAWQHLKAGIGADAWFCDPQAP